MNESEAGRRLSDRQRAFVDAYVGECRFNGTRAAEKAGYKDAHNEAWRLRKNADVQRAIEDRLSAETLNGPEVLAELTAVALAPTSHFMQVAGFDKESGALQVRQDYGSKVKALELLGKQYKLFTDKIALGGADGEQLIIKVVYADRPDDVADDPAVA